MEPKAVGGFRAIRLVGLSRPFRHAFSPDANNAEVIGPLWDAFAARRSEIEHTVGDTSYGLMYAEPDISRRHPDELIYIAGVHLPDGVEPPDGMELFEVPNQIWAQFVHRGPVSTLKETLEGIYDVWLPDSIWLHAGFDMEVYGAGFNPPDEASEMEYWIAVEPKPVEED